MAETSLAAVFTGTGRPLELRPFSLPRLECGELLVRVTCCTLCGSDLHTYQGHRSTPLPTVLGHETIGRIVAIGPGRDAVSQPAGETAQMSESRLRTCSAVCDVAGRPLAVGDRITWSIAASCGGCFFCRDGIPQKCERLFKYGHQAITEEHPLSGGLADHCHLAAGTAVVNLPETLPDAVAAPANCATATVAAAFRTLESRLRTSGIPAAGGTPTAVLVQGAGMLGLTACAMARTRGARHVIVTDVSPSRLETAGRFGATHAVPVGEGDDALTALVARLTSGRGVDFALELSGSAAAIESGLKLLRTGGCYVLVGSVFPGPAVPVSPEAVVRRLLTIQGVHNYAPCDLAAAVAFLAEHHTRYPFGDLVTDNFPLAQAQAAFAHAVTSRAHRVAVVPDPPE